MPGASHAGETNNDSIEIAISGGLGSAMNTGFPTIEYVEINKGTMMLPDETEKLQEIGEAIALALERTLGKSLTTLHRMRFQTDL